MNRDHTLPGSDGTAWTLANRYFLLRHGESVANRQGLIVSDPQRGVNEFGLTDEGASEVRQSVQAAAESLKNVAAIYSSDFLRTRQTAEIAGQLLGLAVRPSPLLRERRFGVFDGQSHRNYDRVWKSDRDDPAHTIDQVESVESVAGRMRTQIDEIEKSVSSRDVLIVSHGDPLQILITAVAGRDLSGHRDQTPIATAEIRRLIAA